MRRTLLDQPRGFLSWPLVPVALAFALGWLVLGWPWLSGAVTVPWDAKAHFQPQIQFLAWSLAHGESPFWAPYVFSGHPQIADPQSLIFSPPFLLLALFNGAPSLRAVDTTVLLTILAGGIGIILYFRDMGWHWAGALLAALGFGFGAAMAWRIQHTGQVLSLAYLPLTLLWLSRALERRSLGYGLVAGLAAAAMVLGRDQVALLGIYVLIGYVVWHWASAPKPLDEAQATVPTLAVGGIAGLAVIALPILMTMLVAGDSNRPAIDLEGAGRGSLHPALLLTLFAPDVFGSSGDMSDYWGPPSMRWQDTGLFIAQNVGQMYVGAVPMLLLILGALTGMLWVKPVRFYTLALGVMIVYALGWYTPAFQVMHAALPGVDLYRRPADAVFLIGYLASILAGYVAHRLLTATLPPLRRWQWAIAALIPVAALGCGLALSISFEATLRAIPPLEEAAVLFAGGAMALAAAAWIYPLRPVVAGGILAVFTVLDLAIANGPGGATALPPSVYEVLEPKSTNDTIAFLKAKVAAGRTDTHRDRIELVGVGFHWPNASLTHRLENTLGYNPVRLGDYTRATGAEDASVSTRDRKLPPLFPSYRSTLADMLGLRWIASGSPIEEADKSLNPGDLNLVARTNDAFIYENPRAMPRVLFATSAQAADFKSILATGIWPEVDFTRTVLLDADAVASLPSSASTAQAADDIGRVKILRYRHDSVEIEAESRTGGAVVLNDIWQPWWFAEVDGRPAPLLKANVLFRAVAVPPGTHRVRFVFRPVAGALSEARQRWFAPNNPITTGGRER